MRLDPFELKKIQDYFNLDKKIYEIQNHINSLREEFYSYTMTTRTYYIEYKIISVGFRLENDVVDLVDNIRLQEKRIKNIKKKQRYFNDFLNSLDPVDKDYLIKRYSKDKLPDAGTPLDVALYDEILEIEEAINYMNGIQPDPLENLKLEEESLEENFSLVLEILGV